jgi:hypothetical protein
MEDYSRKPLTNDEQAVQHANAQLAMKKRTANKTEKRERRRSRPPISN